jgi:hypothetical protein
LVPAVSVSAAIPHSGRAFWVFIGFWSDGTVLAPVVAPELLRPVGTAPPVPWALAAVLNANKATMQREPVFEFMFILHSFCCGSDLNEPDLGRFQ